MTQSTPKIKRKLTQRWWFPTATVLLVLAALVGAEHLGILQAGQDAICATRDFFIEMTGETPDACP